MLRFAFALAFLFVVGQARADEAVIASAKRIDAEIDKALRAKKVPASSLADDAEFLRRAYLDLTGQIPPYEAVVAFLDSKDKLKRAKLIDQLLDSPEFGKHLAGVWSQLLLGTEIAAPSRAIFKNWLAEGINKGKHWDALVFEMLTAEGDVKANPATIFVMAQTEDNKIQPNLLAASTTRYFLGVQLQCAECHNHPFTTYKQTEFWGVAAFFSKVKSQGATKNKTALGITEMPPEVDPTKKEAKKPATAAIGAAIVIPNTAGKGAGKVVAAKFFGAEEPKLDSAGPYRPSLASWVISPDNKYFAKATANRLWAHLFGRGIVNPVDDMHADNEPTNPALLELLASEFKNGKTDLKHLIRVICSTQAYQRSSRPTMGNEDDRDLFSHMAVKLISAEALYDSLTRALGVKELNVTTGKATTPGIGGAAKAGVTTPRDKFVRFFKTQDADSVATDFTHGIPQALNLLNDPQFTRGGPMIEQIVKANLTKEQALDRLFLTTLARHPTAAESQRLTKFVSDQPDPTRAYTGVVWVLINTPEFILNH